MVEKKVYGWGGTEARANVHREASKGHRPEVKVNDFIVNKMVWVEAGWISSLTGVWDGLYYPGSHLSFLSGRARGVHLPFTP